MSSLDLVLHTPEEEVRLASPGLVVADQRARDVSPIEHYFQHTSELMAKLVQDGVSSDPVIQSLGLLGIMSAAEFYFRCVLSRTVSLCPFSHEISDKVQIAFGSSKYYAASIYPIFAAIEHKSLSDAKELKTETRRLTGIEIDRDLSAKKALEQFDQLCHLRHATIHSQGYLSYSNMNALQLPATRFQRVMFNHAKLQDLVKISHVSVRAFNRALFEGIWNRWISRGHLKGSWSSDRVRFTSLIDNFKMNGLNNFNDDPKEAYVFVKSEILSRNRNILTD